MKPKKKTSKRGTHRRRTQSAPKAKYKGSDDGDLIKEVVSFDDGSDGQCPDTPESQGGIVTLTPMPLQELVRQMRLIGYWFNPNLRPEFPDLCGNFTNFLPHLARCRMLVQCNPNQACDQVHHWMTWPGGGSARVCEVWDVPIIGEATFLDQEIGARDRWWHLLRSIIQDTVELRPDQRWLSFYRIEVSYDGRHKRMLRIVHLGCHALTACAYFLAPNRLIPERITDFRRTRK